MESFEGAKCLLCTQDFTDPRTLPNCNHSFCFRCLEKYIKEMRRNCPHCKTKFIVPEERLVSLKKNEFSDRLPGFSEMSGEGDDKKLPVECNQSYSKCSAFHLNNPSNVESSLKSDNEYTICDLHYKKMKLYCNDCKVHACSICFEESDSRHVMTSLKNQFEVVKNKLNYVLKFNEQKCQEIYENLKEINELSSRCYESGNEIKRQIKEKSDALKSLIDSYSNSLMEKVDEEVKSYVERSNDVIGELNEMKLSTELLIEECKKKIENLNYKTVVSTSIEDQIDIDPLPAFQDEFHLIFHPSNSDEINSKMIGNLTSGKDAWTRRESRELEEDLTLLTLNDTFDGDAKDETAGIIAMGNEEKCMGGLKPGVEKKTPDSKQNVVFGTKKQLDLLLELIRQNKDEEKQIVWEWVHSKFPEIDNVQGLKTRWYSVKSKNVNHKSKTFQENLKATLDYLVPRPKKPAP